MLFSHQNKWPAFRVPRRCLPIVATGAALAIYGGNLMIMRPSMAGEISITIPSGARQTLQGIGASQPPRTTPPTYYERVDVPRRNQMMDMVYGDLGMKVLRLWVHLSPTITVDGMKHEFYLSYVDSGLIADAAKRGTTTLLLAPATGTKLTEPVSDYVTKIATFIKAVRDEKNIHINVTGLANEPNFTQTEVVDGVRLLREELDKRGLTDVGIVAPETANTDKWVYGYIDALKADPRAWAGLKGVATHSYNMAATNEVVKRIQGSGKEYWMTEAGDNGVEEPGDTKRAASMAARFLSDMNHLVTHWIWFIGIGHMDPDNDGATKLVRPSSDGGLKVHSSYWYLKQLRGAFQDGAVFRTATSTRNGDMVWTYGDKPALVSSAAKNPDGSWSVGVVNLTGLNSTNIAKFAPAETIEATLQVDELAGSGNVPFQLFRSQANGAAKPEGNLTLIDGKATVMLAPQELVTLRSAPVQLAKTQSPAQVQSNARVAAAPSSEARPMIVRGGLPNVARKLARGEDVSVVFIGGSVTQGGREDGYVAQVGTWLKTQYPKSKISVANAGIGGTNSHYGNQRLDRDVLVYKPDLLIVEFAVNDGGDASSSMEALVHKTWMKNPQTDIVFMHHLQKPNLADYAAGRWHETALHHEKVADFYSIPTIGTGMVLASKVHANELSWEDAFHDTVHPKPAGYAIYTQAITDALKVLLSSGTAGAHILTEKTLTPNLVVYPPRFVPIALPEPEPYVAKTGKKAQTTYALPIVGVHWAHEPEFRVGGNVLWHLSYQSTDVGKKLDATLGLDRSQWKGAMEYFSSGNQFTAAEPKASPLVSRSKNGKGIDFGAKEKTMGVLSFVAPRNGRYVFDVRSNGVRLWSHHKAIALNAVHFPKGQTQGKSVAFHSTTVDEKANLNLEFPVTMQTGDEIAFQVDTNMDGGGGGAYWEGLNITAGYMGP
jgi:lysophospholipase L1-like esterase